MNSSSGSRKEAERQRAPLFARRRAVSTSVATVALACWSSCAFVSKANAENSIAAKNGSSSFSIELAAQATPSRSSKTTAQKSAPASQADVLSTSDSQQPPAADLLLKKENAAKADALASFAEGVIAEEDADADKSLAAYQKTLALDPGYSELAVKIAYELAKRGDATTGIELLKDTIKASPKNALPYLYLSQLYAKYLKKPEIGLKYAQQALDLDPANIATNLAVYELYGETGQQKKADQLLDRAAKLDNSDPQFWLQLGGFYARLWLKEDGSTAPDQLEKMNAVYKKALALAGDDADAIAQVADFYVLSRQTKDAIPLYRKVIDLKQSNPDATLASTEDKLARIYRATGQRDEAIAMLQRLIKDYPLRHESYELLAELFEEKGDLEGALADYQQLLLLEPSQAANYLRVADLLLKLKQSDKALATLQEAHEKFPDQPLITYSLAIACEEAKKNQEAVTAFQEALIEAQNSQPDMLDGRFYFAYGAAAEQAGLTDKAAELLKKSIDLDPSGSTLASPGTAYNYLGYMWVDRNENLDEAGTLIKRALEMEPTNAAYIDSLGWWYFKKGDFQKALDELQKAAATLEPEDAVVYEHLGDTLSKLNNVAQALVYWQKAAALGADDKSALAEKIDSAKQKLAHQPGGVGAASTNAPATPQ